MKASIILDERFRIIILGAGFSRPAGFPLASELWDQIRAYARHLEGRASKFNSDIDAYIDYKKSCEGVALTPDEVDFEEFMEFLDIEHVLGLRGSDTWSDEGNEGTVVAKTLIGVILAECFSKLNEIPDLYLEFARRLQPRDVVITFNYDTLLEAALDAVAKPYRLFPYRYKSVSDFRGLVGDHKDEVVVLKVHGSIDWFDRKHFEWTAEYLSELGASPPSHIIFSHEDELGVRPVTDGPRFDNDPLKTVYRVGNIEALYNKGFLFRATPRMLPPSPAKIVYSNRIGDFWDGLNSLGALNFGMAIVGFSLPAQDRYVRQVIYTLVSNYQHINWDNDVFGKRKKPLVLVNFFENHDDEMAFRNRFRFVNWDRATLHGGGFDRTALDSIFS